MIKKTEHELPFEGFSELIKEPLEESDPLSFKRLKRTLLELSSEYGEPFAFIIKRLTGKTFQNFKAKNHWKQILTHKQKLEVKLERLVSIQTAAVDYFSVLNDKCYAFPKASSATENAGATGENEWLHRIYSPNYHTEQLKNELMRADRYNHALSVILLDVDNFHSISDKLSSGPGNQILNTIVKIIRLTIRSVDDIARYNGDRFLIILPNTNKREGLELAERLRNNIIQRTKRLPNVPGGVTATLIAGQLNPEEKPTTILNKLESALGRAKSKERNCVHVFEGG